MYLRRFIPVLCLLKFFNILTAVLDAANVALEEWQHFGSWKLARGKLTIVYVNWIKSLSKYIHREKDCTRPKVLKKCHPLLNKSSKREKQIFGLFSVTGLLAVETAPRHLFLLKR